MPVNLIRFGTAGSRTEFFWQRAEMMLRNFWPNNESNTISPQKRFASVDTEALFLRKIRPAIIRVVGESGHHPMRCHAAEWLARQITLRDNDRVYGHVFLRRVRAVGIRDRPISPGSPWQKAMWNV